MLFFIDILSIYYVLINNIKTFCFNIYSEKKYNNIMVVFVIITTIF